MNFSKLAIVIQAEQKQRMKEYAKEEKDRKETQKKEMKVT